ncbi:MAG: DUF3810 domain-containing protein [Parafilimonas sp.]|nr:DUF3810 domain-containing protein [Parafilimonas sp.]
MKSSLKRWWLSPLTLLICIVALHLFALRGDWVEKIYSSYIYQPIAFVLRILTSWLPFSVGDVLYGAAFLWLLIKTIQFFFRKPTWPKFFVALRNLLVKCLWVYLIFLLAWGLNYYRYGIGYKLKIYPGMYSTGDLKTVIAKMRDQLNMNRKLIDSLHLNYPGHTNLFREAIQLYDSAKIHYPYLTYKHADVKNMLSGFVGNYSGFLGYYNPFTGEAQVNTATPVFTTPFTTCHEIGHQLGFASESEASFVGYLAIQSGNSPIFKYSVYFDLFAFANGELFNRDSVAAKQNVKLLDTLVKKDYAEYRKYLSEYKNPVEPLLTKLYGNYLKAHNQPKGIQSYDEVVAWVIAYYKQFGKI